MLLRSALCIAVILCLGSCVTLADRNDTPNRFDTGYKQLKSQSGCRYDLTIRAPHESQSTAHAIIGHGFLRSRKRMRDLAIALANSGVTTITIDFCAMKLWNGNHVHNGLEMIEVAKHFNAAQVVYVGFSAGALAALVAGGNDPNTNGVVLLDFVDLEPIGKNALATLSAPLVSISGAPSACNKNGTSLNIFDHYAKTRAVKIESASHCAFESPSDWLCRRLCKAPVDEHLLRKRIIKETVSAVVQFAK